MPKISPLHSVIDATRWAAELPLGRLVILAHAAFLHAGFLPAAGADKKNSVRAFHDACFFFASTDGEESSVRIPVEVGRTASKLSLRYTAPQLLHRSDAATVAMKVCAHGRNLVFYVCVKLGNNPWLDTYWVCLDDAVAAARLVSGDLDDTARALRRDTAPLAALWSALTDGLCRRVLVDVCGNNGVALEPDPSFMSLPGDLKAAILARLAGADDLARVECTCAGLRRLIAERDAELWKPRYEKLPFLAARLLFLELNEKPSTELSWKERYMAERWFGRRIPSRETRPMFGAWRSWRPIRLRMFEFDPPATLPEEIRVPCRRTKWRAMPRDGCCHHDHVYDGHKKKQRHGAGAVHSPSSRHRWNHR